MNIESDSDLLSVPNETSLRRHFAGWFSDGSLEMVDVDFDEDTRFLNNYTEEYWDNYDTSQTPFPNTLWNVKPIREIVIKSTIMFITAVIGLFLNFVILLIIVKNKWLCSASNFLIFNMAFIDFVTLLLCPWFMLIRDFYQNYVLKNFGCRFEGFLQATLLLASVGALCLVCYDRLAAAALSVEARVTKKVAPKLAIGSWVLSALLSLPWIINRTYEERVWLDYVEMYCVGDIKVLGMYWHFTLTLLVWIPLGLMAVTYGAIIWRLECTTRELSSRGGGRTITRVRSRALRITTCVLVAGGVCRVPYTVLMYWRNNLEMQINAVDGSFNTMWFVANFMMYANSAVNPLIYGFTNLRFRKAMDRTMPVAICKFGFWCCVCPKMKKKQIEEDKNTEKIFVIENTPRPNKKFKAVIKQILHINRETVELSGKNDEVTTKPTKVTPVRAEDI